MSKSWTDKLIPTGEATAILPIAEGRVKPVTVIGPFSILGRPLTMQPCSRS